MSYVKFRFTGRSGETAGLVIDANRFRQLSIGDLSRMFPYSESGKMARLQVSKEYSSFAEAFGHTF